MLLMNATAELLATSALPAILKFPSILKYLSSRYIQAASFLNVIVISP